MENETPLETLVYNKEFREQNFGKGKLNGVFTLGHATTIEIKVIEDKIEERIARITAIFSTFRNTRPQNDYYCRSWEY